MPLPFRQHLDFFSHCHSSCLLENHIIYNTAKQLRNLALSMMVDHQMHPDVFQQKVQMSYVNADGSAQGQGP